jgi:hypothetical protein
MRMSWAASRVVNTQSTSGTYSRPISSRAHSNFFAVHVDTLTILDGSRACYDSGTMAPRGRIYLEATVVSYLAARPSRDLRVAAHQQATSEWWTRRRGDFDLFASQLVVEEASAGNEEAAQRRLEYLKGVPLLDLTDRTLALAEKHRSENSLGDFLGLDQCDQATARLNSPQRTFTAGDESPRNGGFPNGLGNERPETPETKYGKKLARNAQPMKYVRRSRLLELNRVRSRSRKGRCPQRLAPPVRR